MGTRPLGAPTVCCVAAGRPSPGRWIWYAYGGGLPRHLSPWVLEDVTRAVSRLPEIDQQIFRLCLVEDLSYADAAAQLDVQVGSVRNRLSRLRRMLGSSVEVG